MSNPHNHKVKTKKRKEPFISEDNRMDPKAMEGFLKNKDKNEGKPIIEMDEERVMPLYMFIGTIGLKTTFGEATMDLMCTVIHLKKTGELEIRGRMRYQDTGNKDVFTIPKTFKLEDLEKAKKEIKNLYAGIFFKEPRFEEKEPPFELNFKVNEDIDGIIEKMNKSNKFNIGIAPKK